MNRPTQDQAVAYVTALEATYDYSAAGHVTLVEDISDDGFPMVRVVTADDEGVRSDWAVWFQMDGTLYGEC